MAASWAPFARPPRPARVVLRCRPPSSDDVTSSPPPAAASTAAMPLPMPWPPRLLGMTTVLDSERGSLSAAIAAAAAAPASVGCSSSFSSASASGTAANGCLRALPRPRLAGGASGTAAELVACCERLLRVVRPLLAVPPPLVPDDDNNNNNNETHAQRRQQTRWSTRRNTREKTGNTGARGAAPCAEGCCCPSTRAVGRTSLGILLSCVSIGCRRSNTFCFFFAGGALRQ